MRIVGIRLSLVWLAFWVIAIVVLGTTRFGYAFVPSAPDTVTSQAVAQSERFGIAHVSYGDTGSPVSDSGRYLKATEAGARWNRWSVYWHDVQRAPGPQGLDFSRVDATVQTDREYGLEPLLILQGTPCFYAPAGCTLAANQADESQAPPPPRVEDKSAYFAFLRGEYVRPQAPNPATQPPTGLYNEPFVNGQINPNNPWAYFVYQTATRYRGKVHAYEIWNEPDFDAFWTGSVADYLQLLRVAYRVIKSVDPNARVLVGGMMYWQWALTRQQEHAWLRAFLDELSKDPSRAHYNYYFDGIPWHLYIRVGDLYTLTLSAQALLAQHGITGKELWVTETNIPACNEPPAYQPCTDLGTANLSEQASYVIQAFAYSFAAGVQRTFIFQHYDDGNAQAFGLLRNNSTYRPAYTAYQVAARYLGRFDRVQRVGTGEVERIVFDNSAARQRVHVIFNKSPYGQFVVVPASSSTAKLVQQDGWESTISSTNGTYQIWATGATNNRGFGGPGEYVVGGWTQLIVEPYALDKRAFLPVFGR